MSIPNSPSFTQIPNTVQELLKGYRTYDKVMKRGLIDVKNTTRFVSEQIKENTKLAKELKQVNDAFYKKMPGGGTPKNAGIAGGQLLSIVLQGGLAAAIIHSTLVQNFINDIFDKNLTRTGDDISKTLSAMQTIKSRVDNLKTRFEALNSTIKDTLDKTRAEIGGASRNATDARQKANDALYEARVGRAKLEAQIADAKQKSNDALYEIRQGRVKLEAQIADAKKQSNDALYETRQGRSKLEAQITSLQNQFKQLNNAANAEFQKQIQATIANINKGIAEAKQQFAKAENKVTVVEKAVTTVQNTVSNLQSTVQSVKQQSEQWGVQVTTFLPKLAEVTSGLTIWKAQVVEPQLAQVTQSQFSTSARVDNLEKVVTGQQQQIQNSNNVANSASNQVNQQEREIDKVKTTIIQINPTKQPSKQDLDDIKKDLDKTKQDLNNLKPELGKLQTKINEQEKMNQQGLDKLNQITPLVGLIPGLANNTANKVREFTPTIPQIEQAAATGTCRTTQPGGCSRKMIDDAVNNINSNTNSKSNDLLDKINAGANAAQLALLQTIDNKLGIQLPGGLSGAFGRLWKIFQIDRVLNVLTYITVLHNALMLSNNIATTLFSAIDNISQSTGFKWQNEKGEDVSFGQIVGEWSTNFFKSMFGAENYTNLVKAWKAANRIYQAAANVVFAIQSMQQSILNALEVIGSGVAKVANALRAAGKVFDQAYEWMNPQPNFDNALFRKLETVQQVASSIETVSQTPLEVQSALNSLKEERNNMKEALKDGENALSGLGIIESENEKKKATERKNVSAGKDLEGIDKVEADS